MPGTDLGPKQIVDTGYNSRYCVKTDGTLWSWGDNSQGQLGHGNTTNLSSPVQVGGLTTWLDVAAGNYTTYASTTSNALYAWGKANMGQLGDGTTVNKSSPIQVGTETYWNVLPRIPNANSMVAVINRST